MSNYSSQLVIFLVIVLIIIKAARGSGATSSQLFDVPKDVLVLTNHVAQNAEGLDQMQHQQQSNKRTSLDITSHQSIYSSLKKILNQLKSQLDAQNSRLSSRRESDEHDASAFAQTPIAGINFDSSKLSFKASPYDQQANKPPLVNEAQSVVTLNISDSPISERYNRELNSTQAKPVTNEVAKERDERNATFGPNEQVNPNSVKFSGSAELKGRKSKPGDNVRLAESSHLKPAKIKAPARGTQTTPWPKFSQRLVATTANPGPTPSKRLRATTARSLALGNDASKDDNEDEADYIGAEFGPPLFSVSSSKYDYDSRPNVDHMGNDAPDLADQRARQTRRLIKKKALQFADGGDVTPSRAIENFASDSLDQPRGDGEETNREVFNAPSAITTPLGTSGQSAKLNPSSIHLQRVNTSPLVSTSGQYQQKVEPLYASNSIQANSPSLAAQTSANLLSSLGSSLNNSPQSANYYQLGTMRSASAALTPLTSASGSNQFQNRDLLHQPQTIQITALPNGATGNSLIRINGLPMVNTGQFNQLQPGMLGFGNNGLFGDPFAGRQLFMVGNQQAERRQIDWSIWIWPLLAALALPLVLAALFVPIFLKTIVILIQILQSLGLLLPLASAIGQQLVQASNAQMSSTVGQLDQHQVQAQQQQHVQKLSASLT